MKYTVFNKKTGQIIKTGICNDSDFELQARGNSIVEGHYSDSEYYWDNGFVKIPEKPSEFHIFDMKSKSWVAIENAKIEEIRIKRNFLLKESDWTQMPDSPLSSTKKSEWAEYRQKLRDITNQDINLVVFPDKP